MVEERDGEPDTASRPGGRLRRATSAAARALPVPSFLRVFGRYLVITVSRAHRESLFLTASALAYISVLSAIPLLAAFSFIGERIFREFQARSLDFFTRVLPYSDEAAVEQVAEFLSHAESLRGLGLAIFLSTSLLLFITVEETFNQVWKVGRRRPFRVRLLSFLLLLFWGPLLVGATFSSLVLLQETPIVELVFDQPITLSLFLFLLKTSGLTMLYWLVPYTSVRFRSALAGGALAAVLLELLRQGFGFYVNLARGASAVYGSYAFALFFAISIELTWVIVLLGSELAYTAQYFRALVAGEHRRVPLALEWLGLAGAARIAERFAAGRPILSRDELAADLKVPPQRMEAALAPLVRRGILRRVEEDGSYLLAAEPARVPVERVLAAYDRRGRSVVERLPVELGRLRGLNERLRRSRREILAGATLADLLASPAESAAEVQAAAAPVLRSGAAVD